LGRKTPRAKDIENMTEHARRKQGTTWKKKSEKEEEFKRGGKTKDEKLSCGKGKNGPGTRFGEKGNENSCQKERRHVWAKHKKKLKLTPAKRNNSTFRKVKEKNKTG